MQASLEVRPVCVLVLEGEGEGAVCLSVAKPPMDPFRTESYHVTQVGSSFLSHTCVSASARQSRAQCCAREFGCKILSLHNTGALVYLC